MWRSGLESGGAGNAGKREGWWPEQSMMIERARRTTVDDEHYPALRQTYAAFSFCRRLESAW